MKNLIILFILILLSGCVTEGYVQTTTYWPEPVYIGPPVIVNPPYYRPFIYIHPRPIYHPPVRHFPYHNPPVNRPRR